MKQSHPYESFRIQVKPALQSKTEEFKLLGYETISNDSLWEFLMKKKWRKPKENPFLFEIVQDIMAVSIGDYMNYVTVESFKEARGSFDFTKDLKELL